MKHFMLGLAILCLIGCADEPGAPANPAPTPSTSPRPNSRLEHAIQEQDRIKKESGNDPKVTEALEYLQEALSKKRKETDPLTANAWFDDELTGKTPADIIAKWGPKQ